MRLQTFLLACIVAIASAREGASSDLAAPESLAFMPGTVLEAFSVTQSAAESLFQSAEAAIYVPSQSRVVLFRVGPPSLSRAAAPEAGRTTNLRDFVGELSVLRCELAREGAEYIVKIPAVEPPHGEAWRKTRAKERLSPAHEAAPHPASVVFFDDFESGLSASKWFMTADQYRYAITTCGAHSGSRSVDAVRGGLGAILGCDSPYPGSVETVISPYGTNIYQASSAYVELWASVSTDPADKFSLLVSDPKTANWIGYSFSGSLKTWFLVRQDAKSWSTLGDLTTADRDLDFWLDFRSDASVQSGFGARVDDFKVETNVASADLSVSQDRVSVSLTWRNQYNGTSGTGKAVKQMDQYGYFWFDSDTNPEVFVKVLDFGGPAYLVFHSALSDLEYTVNFKVVRTGKTYSFKRDAGSVSGLADGSTVLK